MLKNVVGYAFMQCSRVALRLTLALTFDLHLQLLLLILSDSALVLIIFGRLTFNFYDPMFPLRLLK